MTIAHIQSAVKGLSNSLTFTQTNRMERSIGAGENAIFTALVQVGESIGVASSYVDFALEKAGMTQIPFAGHVVIHITPLLLGIARAYDLIPEPLRPACVFIHHHISVVYEVAAVVSSIALIYFGQPVFGGISLAVLALGFLDRQGYLPVEVRQIIHHYTEPALIVSALIGGGIIDRILALGQVVSLAAYVYLHYFRAPPPREELIPNNLTPQIMRDFLQNRIRFAVNPKHIHCLAMPPIPEVDIEILMHEFDQIYQNPDDETMRTLREKCRLDARFQTNHGNPDEITNAALIAVVREDLNAFIQTVKGRLILEGEPKDYDKLHNFVKIVADYIQKLSDPVVKIDFINSLAVDGGRYCGPGKFEAAESLFAQVMSQSLTVPLQDKVLICLQDERNRWMQAFYVATQKHNPMLRALDFQDIHIYNIFLNCYGDEFGLRKTAAENDESAIIDALSKCLISFLMGNLFLKEGFWGDHQIENLVNALCTVAGTSQLPTYRLLNFWTDWVMRQDLPQEEREALIIEVSTQQSLYGMSLLTEDGQQFNPQSFSLMLFDMGIAQIETPEIRAARPRGGLMGMFREMDQVRLF